MRNQYFNSREYLFEPIQSLEGKQNWGKHYFIAADGSVQEVVRLNILDDRAREEVIAFHFCRQYAELHYHEADEQPQFYVVGRDSPWDFDYRMHDDRRFSLEIRRVADTQLLKAMKAENEVLILLQQEMLRAYEIRKIEKLFPGLLDEKLVRAASTASRRKCFAHTPKVDQVHIFIRPPIDPELDLTLAVREAIESKANKNHLGKESTILLLDNLTTHSDPESFFKSAEQLEDLIDEVPFPSIWVYTGYYSDFDCEECEYGLLPIKLSDPEAKVLNQRRSEQGQG